eukprot:647360-Alexandrium_andersonii.AAC.1
MLRLRLAFRCQAALLGGLGEVEVPDAAELLVGARVELEAAAEALVLADARGYCGLRGLGSSAGEARAW